MSKTAVFIAMFAIIATNAIVFGVIYVNSSSGAVPTIGIQTFDTSTGDVRSGGQIYGDFALNLDKPMDVTLTGQFIYVSDTNNYRIQVFSLAGEPLFAFGKQGDGPGEFRFPYGISGDSQDRVYVADMHNNNISIFQPDGEFIGYFAEHLVNDGKMRAPGGLRIINDLVYITDIQANKVFVLNLAGDLLVELGGIGEEPGKLLAPNAVTADNNGNIYVVDTGNQRVQVFDAQGNYQFMFNGATNEEGDAVFVNPRGIGITTTGHIYVVSNITHLVHAFDMQGTPLYTLGGMGDGDGKLFLPNGLFIDSNNTIYVTDTLNQRISIFSQ